MPEQNQHIVVIGGGQAAADLIVAIRKHDPDTPITLIGDEALLPYSRPPLSKAYLKGELRPERLPLRNQAFYDAKTVTLQLGRRAVAIDRDQRSVTDDHGETHRYTALVLATGLINRRLPLPGADAPNVYTLRDKADADALAEGLTPGRRLVVIGGGYIGLEVAASARMLGLEITVIEREQRLLARVAGQDIAAMIGDRHREQGVRLLCATDVIGLNTVADGRVDAVDTAQHGSIPADIVLVGIGGAPNTILAEQAGLEIDNGIMTDADGRTSDPHIFAAGDCASYPDAHYGARLRVESISNAQDRARAVAAAICRQPAAKTPLPWFWSDQYDMRLQIAGIIKWPGGGADRVFRRDDPEKGGTAFFHLLGKTIVAAECLNFPKAFMLARSMLPMEIDTPELIADPNIDLKQLLSLGADPRDLTNP